MAENKKSFVLYCDIIHTFKALDDLEAGRLIKHILEYVNDLNPESPDKLTTIAFEPIKQQLKRDLVKWEGERVERSHAGKLGGIKSGEARRKKAKQSEAKPNEHKQGEANEASASNTKQTQANEAVNVNVSVNVNDSVEYKEFMKSYSDFFVEKTGLPIKIDGGDGKALKTIISYMRAATKEKGGNPVDGWNLVLQHYDRWDKFHQGQLTLKQINSNLANILNSIRNGKQITEKGQSIFRD